MTEIFHSRKVRDSMARNRNFKYVPDIVISDAHITGRPNFSGIERTNPNTGRVVNSAGNRNFCVDIPVDGIMANDGSNKWLTVDELVELGWPIKAHASFGDEEEPPSYYLPIKVGYKFRPPTVYLVAGNKRHDIGEKEIDTFDGRQFNKVDLIVHPSVRQDWDTGDTAITAYLAEGWFYIAMSPFQQSWEDEHPEE